MGYDSNIKSDRAEQRQRMIIIVSLVALAAACFLIVGVLRPDPIQKLNANKLQNGGLSDTRLKAAKALAEIKKAAAITDSKPEVLPVSQLRSVAGGAGDGTSVGAASSAAVAAGEANTREEQENIVAKRVADLTTEVRAIKKTSVIMETDEHSLEMTGKLQEATRELIKLRYGDAGSKNYRIRMDLEFQPTIPDFEERGKDATLLLELAPISLIPCSVFNFLEIARTWKNGAFHRNAGHVLQALARSDITQSMPFQEYSKEYPHKKGTVGYAGRPSGPEFYISIEDNTRNHGPGSQQKHNPYEADCIIGTIIEGMSDVVPRIHKMPGKEFIGDKKKWVLIRRMHILVPGDGPGSVDGYIEFSKSPLVLPE
mmetsp:Transcript_11310/g.24025  ORF Transcript_11310/g.24025 Transcript_11310/m.24025 type:complete len:370 (+) Transcript_11310:144-1253(+)